VGEASVAQMASNIFLTINLGEQILKKMRGVLAYVLSVREAEAPSAMQIIKEYVLSFSPS